MSIHLALLQARKELQERAGYNPRCLAYLREHRIDQAVMHHHVGAYTVTVVDDLGNGRFDFGNGTEALVLEAYGDDDETVVDLVGWPIGQPDRILSVFGRCGLLGVSQAFNPSSYFWGEPLAMHRNPLEWMQAGCVGAAVVTPHLAARQIIDLPGRIAARDRRHGHDLARLAQSVVDRNKVLIPSERRAA